MAYDGTDYVGWQVQPGRPTIQGTLAEAIWQVTGERVLPQGSGRTDSGVHAEGQIVSVHLQAAIPSERLALALNRKLPAAIRVRSAVDAPHTFHARARVRHKTYEYRVFLRYEAGSNNQRVCLPSVARYAWDCRWPLQVEPMQLAAQHFAGTHDFTSFAATDPDRTQRLQAAHTVVNNVRTVFASCWEAQSSLLCFRVTGSGFLHHMVRNMVGTCVAVGAGRMPHDAIPAILQARDRARAAETAPPQGLHLVQVVYLDDQSDSGQTA